jgi:hypothetical protein
MRIHFNEYPLQYISITMHIHYNVHPLKCTFIKMHTHYNAYPLQCISVTMHIHYNARPLQYTFITMHINYNAYPLKCISVTMHVHYNAYPLQCISVTISHAPISTVLLFLDHLSDDHITVVYQRLIKGKTEQTLLWRATPAELHKNVHELHWSTKFTFFFFVPRGKISNPDSTFNAEFKYVSSFSPSPTVFLWQPS